MNSTPKDDDNQREALHVRLQCLLAGYVDDELSPQEQAIVEAHLVSCDACRNDVARQQALVQRLNAIPNVRMSAQLHKQVDEALSNADTAKRFPANWRRLWPRPANLNWLTQSNSFIGASGWATALILAIVLVVPPLMPLENRNIPMVQDALAEYNNIDYSTLPAPEQLSTVKLPANWPNAHLLATWKTEIGGAAAQAYAVRSGRHIVFQYRIDEAVFFRNPDVRQAVADNGNYRTQSNATIVLALPLQNAGLLVVGPADIVPSPEQLTLESI